MKIAMIGLGKMGANMAERLRRRGHDVVGFDRDPELADVDSLEDAVTALDGEPRRVVWVMVPAGEPTETTVQALAELLGEGDLVVDGGNSNVRDSQRQAQLLAERGIGFVDAGVSGGVWGLDQGYCIMAGGRTGRHRRPSTRLRRAGHRGRLRARRAGRAPATSSRWSTTASSTH